MGASLDAPIARGAELHTTAQAWLRHAGGHHEGKQLEQPALPQPSRVLLSLAIGAALSQQTPLRPGAPHLAPRAEAGGRRAGEVRG